MVLFFFPTPPFLPWEGHQPHVLLVTLLPGSVGLSLHLPGSPEPNSGYRSYFRQSRILTIPLPFYYLPNKTVIGGTYYLSYNFFFNFKNCSCSIINYIIKINVFIISKSKEKFEEIPQRN